MKNMLIPKNAKVITHIGSLTITGVIVGKSNNSISESYIIKCTDGQLPNAVYIYDTFVSPLMSIEIMDVSTEEWVAFEKYQQYILVEQIDNKEN